jgi:hypothetical protein
MKDVSCLSSLHRLLQEWRKIYYFLSEFTHKRNGNLSAVKISALSSTIIILYYFVTLFLNWGRGNCHYTQRKRKPVFMWTEQLQYLQNLKYAPEFYTHYLENTTDHEDNPCKVPVWRERQLWPTQFQGASFIFVSLHWCLSTPQQPLKGKHLYTMLTSSLKEHFISIQGDVTLQYETNGTTGNERVLTPLNNHVSVCDLTGWFLPCFRCIQVCSIFPYIQAHKLWGRGSHCVTPNGRFIIKTMCCRGSLQLNLLSNCNGQRWYNEI